MSYDPSVRTDVPPPGELWARGVVKAMLAPYLDDRAGRLHVDGGGLRTDDIGNGYWALRWVEGGRAVLYGYDNDYPDTHIQDLPADLLAGGPAWLPWEWLQDLLVKEGWSVAFLRWWDGSWAGAPIPEDVDDGLPIILADDAVSMDGIIGEDGSPSAGAHRDLMRAVTSGTVDQAAVEALLAALDLRGGDAREALDVAARAGVTRDAVLPELPAGQGEPPGRRVPVVNDDHLPAVTAMAAREGVRIDEPSGGAPLATVPPRFCFNGPERAPAP
ncbi:hypothetical protein GCM10009527_051350 [Actinomadura nitritigenes]|uniref:Uncharacterized protein n=1 Tax=Actinomadura nitritigenes TaxID=134602 RepID=A0ABS3RBS9_9ACTN|nr:hypothetical protein [Actinomadura nitritigenes]MBO2443689.1 hypothetical protein [Actinomadura nitritigenes]